MESIFETVLLTIGFMGVAAAILTPFTKTGAVVTLGSFVGYFYLLEPSSWIPVLLFTIGLLLIITEAFIPDFGLVGILGIGALGLGLYWTIGDFSRMVLDLSIAVIITAVLIVLLIRKGYSLKNVDKMVLTDSSSPSKPASADSGEKLLVEPGLTGTARTPLRPSGKVEFDGESSQTFDVLSMDGHISTGEKIVVDQVYGTKIIVRKQK